MCTFRVPAIAVQFCGHKSALFSTFLCFVSFCLLIAEIRTEELQVVQLAGRYYCLTTLVDVSLSVHDHCHALCSVTMGNFTFWISLLLSLKTQSKD